MGINYNLGRAMSKNPLESQLLTPEDLAAALQLQPQSLAVWRSRGDGPRYVKVGGRVRYRVADVEAWLRQRDASDHKT